MALGLAHVLASDRLMPRVLRRIYFLPYITISVAIAPIWTSEPDHQPHCPLPLHNLRNGNLNQAKPPSLRPWTVLRYSDWEWQTGHRGNGPKQNQRSMPRHDSVRKQGGRAKCPADAAGRE